MKKILLFTDPHLDKADHGQHKDYANVCTTCLNLVINLVIKHHIDVLIIGGDVSDGSVITNARLDQEYKEKFGILNLLTGGHVYSIVGNHDRKNPYNIFYDLEKSNLIKTTDSLKKILDNPNIKAKDEYFVYGGEGYCSYLDFGKFRIHLMNDTEQDFKIHTRKQEDCTDVLVSHHNWYLPDVTPLFQKSDGSIDGTLLTEADNLVGIEQIFNGHIHHPCYANEIYINDDPDNEISLLNMGSYTTPTKDPDMYNFAYFPILEVSDDSTEVDFSLNEQSFDPTIRFKELSDKMDNSVVEELDSAIESLDVDMTEVLNRFSSMSVGESVDDIKAVASQQAAVYSLDKSVLDLYLGYVTKASEIQT